MPLTRLPGLDALGALVGTEVATSDWVDVLQSRIDAFADATDDHQWIHVEVDRARRESPFGGPIAHGFLTLSLLAHMADIAFAFDGVGMGVNYGFDRLRFTDPVPAGSRVRAHFVLAACDAIAGGMQITWDVTVEREGATKPAVVARWLTRRYFGSA
ncbi:MAG: MaoC family dehydratase [Burkholderiales bacterium]|nr:MaoC family dehydratase [Burkholderiales bacterium]